MRGGFGRLRAAGMILAFVLAAVVGAVFPRAIAPTPTVAAMSANQLPEAAHSHAPASRSVPASSSATPTPSASTTGLHSPGGSCTSAQSSGGGGRWVS